MAWYTLPHTDGATIWSERYRADLEPADGPQPPALKPPALPPKPKLKVRLAPRQPVEYLLPHTNGATIWRVEERTDLVPVATLKPLTSEPPKPKLKLKPKSVLKVD